MEVLTSFVQARSPVQLNQKQALEEPSLDEQKEAEVKNQDPPPITRDVQAALTVIGRLLGDVTLKTTLRLEGLI